MRRFLPLLLVPALAACGGSSPAPPLDEGQLAVVAARAAAYEAGEPLAAARVDWGYAEPWERRRVVFTEIVDSYAERNETPPEPFSRAFFVSVTLARDDAPPLTPEQQDFADRLETQTRELFAGETVAFDNTLPASLEGIPVEYTSQRGVKVLLTRPSPGERVASPLRVEGRVPGPWLFEGVSRIRLVADDGTVLGEGTMRAEGDWMTEEPVPFTAEITFAPPDSGLGWLFLDAANPSGLAENADHAEVPVTFGAP